ncbi:MAG: hypothetical protein A2504_00555 [Bdellovibrionales bacterium RIFOXYD12_FULL_39_22]|nr:MAG: hypothetical protein A2385_03685 [Bdellovibrionales bacterium RIFOXYB1_FULL_39_21]OFZ44012.1 MAG: hypothetical protein A2485_03200 [Bdellovibrionales bacterium RIFOXYC12_FULL_39_17]OFZ48032.1 MAG: hypothetical protein A2404_01595 [Bdellovibrionales bacterium RIFOXYC1_FULL_39_130]OFZ76496.1 MAG: hypothetical protein A2560_11815 [Bdellovibrionales bacterium RIFOXYD1_FULL_39_84]OFZ76610.1 MAG: hypothetical protein A2451_07545 [Bdellovibrionales bacterium RIFOXYC2_FULL_39_8]OFZ95260.1 MAG:
MENTVKESLSERSKKLFLKAPKPFSSRQEINWKSIGSVAGFCVFLFVVVVLILPEKPKDELDFHETATIEDIPKKAERLTATEDTLAQLQSTNGYSRSVAEPLTAYGEGAKSQGGSGGEGSNRDRNTSMILAREGASAKGKLPLGSRIIFKIAEAMTIAKDAMPVVGVVVKDTIYENSVAIPEGAKLYGEISFDDSNERAKINFQSIIFPNGRERTISAIGIGADGRIGIDGDVHSEILKNLMGHTITRFVGAYAEGAMTRGQMGASSGGHANGLKNAVSETAKDYAEGFGEEMKKEQKWIELPAGTMAEAVLNQGFIFKDPGAVNGF